MPLLTLKEAATFLQLHPETVRRLGPQIGAKVGGRWRFAEENLRLLVQPTKGVAVEEAVPVTARVERDIQDEYERQLGLGKYGTPRRHR
jgi:hypothetical protein